MKRVLVIACFLVGLVAATPAPAAAAFVDDEFTLNPGQHITVPFGSPGPNSGNSSSHIRLIMQTDGNLVIYKKLISTGAWQWIFASWTHGNPGARMEMQSDGNLVVYSTANQVLWTPWTYENPGAVLVLSQSGEMNIFSESSQSLYSSASSQLGYNYVSAAPFGPLYADDSNHVHYTIEGNQADRLYWLNRVNGPGGEDVYEPTDVTFTYSASPDPNFDVRWWQDDAMGFFAVAGCRLNNPDDTCNSWDVRFSDELADWHVHMGNNGVCHEFGHTLGLADGGLAGASCLTGGDNNKISTKERDQLNGRY